MAHELVARLHTNDDVFCWSLAVPAGPLIYESFFKYFKGTGGSTLTKQRDPYGPGQTRPGETRQQATTTYP